MPMIAIAGIVHVPRAKQAELQPHLEAYVAAVRAEPGCVVFTLAYDAIDPDLMRVFEIFQDEAAFAAHDESPHVRTWRAAREAIGVGGRDLIRYDISNPEPL